ncbi:MAG: AI-2E family transporter [Oligoflexales bacterium]
MSEPTNVHTDGKLGRLFYFNLAVGAIIIAVAVMYRSLLLSASIAGILTYLLAPSVDWFDRKFHKSPRAVVTVVFIVAMLTAIGFSLSALMPVLYRQAITILKLLPKAMEFLSRFTEPLKMFLSKNGFVGLGGVETALFEIDVIKEFSVQMKVGLEKLWYSTPLFLGGVVNFALVPVFLFFFLKDLPRLHRMATRNIPEDLRPYLGRFMGKVNLRMRAVLKGQVTVAFILGALYCIGLSIIQIDSALVIGIISGICRLIPYFDVVVGVTLSILVIITTDAGFIDLVGVGGVFLVVQLLDGMLITPRVIGESAGIHPLVVISSIIAFGDWFGFFGVLIAIPFVAFVTVIVEALMPVYRSSAFYKS